MSSDQSGIDLEKMRVILNCLTKLFYNLRISGEVLNTFAFTNGTQNWQLEFHREFLDGIQAPEKLQDYVVATVIPAIQANPDKRIEVDARGAFTITDKQP